MQLKREANLSTIIGLTTMKIHTIKSTWQFDDVSKSSIVIEWKTVYILNNGRGSVQFAQFCLSEYTV